MRLGLRCMLFGKFLRKLRGRLCWGLCVFGDVMLGLVVLGIRERFWGGVLKKLVISWGCFLLLLGLGGGREVMSVGLKWLLVWRWRR